MTRKECETIVASCLKTIRDTVRMYNPKIEQINMAVTKDFAWAFSLRNGEAGNYLLEVHTHYGLNPEEEHDESDS